MIKVWDSYSTVLKTEKVGISLNPKWEKVEEH